MNILVINHYAGSVQHGMEYRPFYLAREWVRCGHNVTILAASFSHVRSKNPIMHSNWQEESIEGVRFVWVKTPEYRGNGYKRALNIFSFVLLILVNNNFCYQAPPQIVIASSTYPLDIYPAKRIARKFGSRLIYEVHDLWPLSLIEIGKMSTRHPFVQILQWAEDYAYRNADRVVSILPQANSYMIEHGMTQDKFVYIPNGIDIAEWHNQNISLPNEYQHLFSTIRKEGKFIIGYTGSHGLANALDTLLDAACLLKDDPVHFVLVGDGPEKARLQTRCSQESIANVLFLNPLEKNQIPALLSNMDIFYLGLKDEPLFRFGISPNKLVDYMMAEKPILSAINAGNDPVAESGCGISVPPENPGAVVSAIRHFISLDRETLCEMGLRGRNYCLREHDYHILADKFINSIS